MGNKVSVIRGVKSNDYYKPGNAINEIWLGHLELISRLPFGDSDLGQSAWPTGGWPKIPWHNFIIPLKRRGLDQPDDDGYRNHHHLPVSADTVSFETASLIAAWVLLFLVLLSYSVPIVLRRYSIPYDMIHGKDKVEQRKGGYALRAYVATTALFIGLVLSVLDLQALVVTRRVGDSSGSNLMLLQVLAALVSMVGLWYAIKAVYALWTDWKKISRQKIDDDIGAPSAVLEEKLPPILLSWMERQRRP